MNELKIEISDSVSEGDVRVIENGLNLFNDRITGINDRVPLSVVIKNARAGETLGGILGRSSLGLLFIDLVYLPASLRGKNIGSDLLRRFENEGRKRGCLSAVLYTISFQAPEFYKKNGWEEFGRIDCAPEGTSRIFMMKRL